MNSALPPNDNYKAASQYSGFVKEKKASSIDYIRHEVSFTIKGALEFVANAINMLIKKKFSSEEGATKEALFQPTSDQWKDNLKDSKLTPFELAQALGFRKTAQEVNQELAQVPTRVIGGTVLEGEHEGDKGQFLKQLGLTSSSQKTPTTPFSEALSLSAGVSQGYSVGTHSMMVVRMFDQHLAGRFQNKDKFKGIVTIDEFRLFLMLHDIGKGMAVKEEGQFETKARKEKELRYCQESFDLLVKEGIIDEAKGKLFKALLDDVTIGKFLKGEISKDKAAAELQNAMKDLDIDPMKFFSLAKIFHIADAGAYKNLRNIQGLFEVNQYDRVRYVKTDLGNSTEKIRVPAGNRMQELKNCFKFYSYPLAPINRDEIK